jgi:subtilisin family serine protease
MLTITTFSLSLMAIFILSIGTWIFPKAISQTPGNISQEKVSTDEGSAAEEQRQAAAKLTRSPSFDQRFQQLSEKVQKTGTVPVIVKVRAAFRPEGQISSAAERLAQRSVIKETQDRLLAGLRYVPASLKRYESIPYLAVIVDSYGLAQLQSSAEVLDLNSDKALKLATRESLPLIKATKAWAGGYMGTGETVAILDSGVDKTHSDLSDKVVAEACFSTNNAATDYVSLPRQCPIFHGCGFRDPL